MRAAPGNHHEGMIDVPIRDRNSCTHWNRSSAGHAWDNFERNSGFTKSASFFRASAEDARVATLQPADGLSLSRAFDHEFFGVTLLNIFSTGFFSHVDSFGARS